MDSLSPHYYQVYSLLTPFNTSSSQPASATTSSTCLLSTSLSRLIPTTTTNNSDRVSPTVYKVYSARATLIDPNRPVKKKKSSITSSTSTSNTTSTTTSNTSSSTSNHNSIHTVATSSGSNNATAAALNTGTHLNNTSTEPNVSLSSVLKKRGPGRPPNADKEIATTHIDSTSVDAMSGNNSRKAAYTGKSINRIHFYRFIRFT